MITQPQFYIGGVMQHTLAILHMDEEYAYSLMDFMNRHKEFGFKVYAFTNKEIYFEFQKKQKVHILLFDESIASEELNKVNTVSMYYLSEVPKTKEFEGHPAIFMYQSANQMIRKVCDLYTSEGNQLISGKQVDQTHIFGICSVVYDQSQCDLCFSIAKEYADQGKTLFLSLQPFISKAMLDLGLGYELSEAIYLIKKGENNLPAKLKSLITSVGTYDLLVGIEHYSDITDMTTDEVLRFMDALLQLGTYQYIILDLTMPGGATSILLSQCEKIFEPEAKDNLSDQMKKEFYRQLILKEGEGILSRIQVVGSME